MQDPAAQLETLWSAPIGFAIVDLELRFVRVNAAFAELDGVPAEDHAGRSVLELLPGLDARIAEQLRRARDGGVALDTEVAGYRPREPGFRRFWRISCFPVREAGRVVGAAAAVVDITDRKRAELESRGERDFCTAILDTVANVIVALDLDGRIVRINSACERVTGYSASEVLGRSVFETFVPDGDLPGTRETFSRLGMGDFPNTHENRWRMKDGSERLFEWSNTAIADEHGAVKFIIGTGTDVTDRRRTEEALASERERVRQIARFPEENPDPVFRISDEHVVSYANPAARSLLNVVPGAETPGPIDSPARQAVIGRTDVRTELRVGDRMVALHFVANGAEVNVFGHDVTDRWRLENRVRRMYESGLIGVLYWTIDGAITDANDKFLELTGYTREDLEDGRIDWARMTPPEWRYLDELALANFRATGISPPFEKEYVRKDGSRVPIMVGGAMLDDTRREGVAFVIDIRDRKATETALRESEQRLRGVFETAALGIAELDAQDRFVAVNPRLCDILGYRRDELLGRHIEEATVPEDRVIAAENHQRLREGRAEVCEYEKRCLRRDGTPLWVHVTASAMRDLAGTYRGAVGTVGDISARRAAEAERDKLLDALREADRRKSEFLGMLSHELRNPLAPIRNSLYILARAAPGGEQARRALAVIDRQVQHTTRLVDDLLDVTRITRGKIRLQRERLDVCALARRTVEDHRELFARNGVELAVVVPREELVVDADSTRLAQVVGNLLNNAIKFTPRAGRTTLAVERAGAFAEITVRDTGAGIASDVLPQLFQPFMQLETTLDRSAGGLGLGLALVKGLVELHGGSVRVESDGAGKGASFVVRLPLDRRRPRRVTVVPARQTTANARRVLLIEDNIDAAESMKEALELRDHLVEIALTGPDGLEKAHAGTADVIICDIGLPGMDGFQVAKAIRANPRLDHVPLIALSGYAQPEDVERSRQAGFDLHLAKPPDLDALERDIVQLRATADGTG